jgi:alpha-methylacyl-CoA racemase
MMLADMGAEVIRVERPTGGPSKAGDDRYVDQYPHNTRHDLLNRSRRSIVINLKDPAGVALSHRLLSHASVVLEGFRPGVAERLGIGPEACLATQPALVYGRVTGWGRDGPYAPMAGHDINYIALAGALAPIGPASGPPEPPLNLVGDFGGGGMLLAFGIVCALLEARASGKGQVVDAAMIDGSALLTTMLHGMRASGHWLDDRGSNVLDGGSPYYQVYETSDGGFVSIGCGEPEFYRGFIDALGLDPADLPSQDDRSSWPQMRERLAAMFRGRTRDEWCSTLTRPDVCFAPVLTLAEAPAHPHHVGRGTFIDVDGVTQPAPAPRFSRTEPSVPRPPRLPGEDTDEVLTMIGIDIADIEDMRRRGVVS